MVYFWIALSYIGFGLEAILLCFLFRRRPRELPFFLAYICARVLASIATSAYFYIAPNRALYAAVYWTLDLTLHGLLIAVLVALAARYIEKTSPPMVAAGAGLLTIFFIGSMVAPLDVRFGYWMTGAVRNLSFYEETLNLILWTLLIRRRGIAPRILWICAGLGIQVTGEVMGHSLRLFSSHSALWAPDVLINICEFTALGMWLYALQPMDAAITVSFRDADESPYSLSPLAAPSPD